MLYFFFFNDTETTEIYTLSLHDALPISEAMPLQNLKHGVIRDNQIIFTAGNANKKSARSEEHTSELQSRQYLVCRLLLEKKKKHSIVHHNLSENTDYNQ